MRLEARKKNEYRRNQGKTTLDNLIQIAIAKREGKYLTAWYLPRRKRLKRSGKEEDRRRMKKKKKKIDEA
jgi:hypothetical protein